MREDGTPVSLDELEERLKSGGTLGSITVNGKSVEAEKVQQLISSRAALEFLRSLDTDVKITDEHIENMQSLMTQIANNGLNENNSLLTSGITPNEMESLPRITFTVSKGYNGSDPGRDGVVNPTDTESVALKTQLKVTAHLDKASPLPISCHYRTIRIDGYSYPGMLNWEANDSSDKEFTFYVSAYNEDGDGKHSGNEICMIQVDNFVNAVCGDCNAWECIVPVTAAGTGTTFATGWTPKNSLNSSTLKEKTSYDKKESWPHGTNLDYTFSYGWLDDEPRDSEAQASISNPELLGNKYKMTVELDCGVSVTDEVGFRDCSRGTPGKATFILNAGLCDYDDATKKNKYREGTASELLRYEFNYDSLKQYYNTGTAAELIRNGKVPSIYSDVWDSAARKHRCGELLHQIRLCFHRCRRERLPAVCADLRCE